MAFPIPEEPPVIKTTLLIVAFIGFTKNKKILPKEDYFGLNSKIESEVIQTKKKNGKRPTSHRSTTYPCYGPILGESAGAGRVGLAGTKIQSFYIFTSALLR